MRASVVVILVFVSLLSASGKAPPQFFCGRRLADTLALFCPSTELVKRAGFHERRLFPDNEVEGAESRGSLGALGAGWLWRGARGKRGVIAECCDQPCTLDELLTYC